MLPPRLRPLPLIPRQSRYRTPNRPPHPITYTLAQIINLPSSFLAFALRILPLTLLLQSLGAHESAQRFLRGADVLVPCAGCAVVVVSCDAA